MELLRLQRRFGYVRDASAVKAESSRSYHVSGRCAVLQGAQLWHAVDMCAHARIWPCTRIQTNLKRSYLRVRMFPTATNGCDEISDVTMMVWLPCDAGCMYEPNVYLIAVRWDLMYSMIIIQRFAIGSNLDWSSAVNRQPRFRGEGLVEHYWKSDEIIFKSVFHYLMIICGQMKLFDLNDIINISLKWRKILIPIFLGFFSENAILSLFHLFFRKNSYFMFFSISRAHTLSYQNKKSIVIYE